MSNFLLQKTKIGRLIGSIIAILWIIFNFAMSLRLFLEQRYYAGIGWLIILSISIFFAYLYHLPLPKKIKHKGMLRANKIKSPKKNAEFVLLFSTKDHIKIAIIKDALLKNGIRCKVLGQHSEGMMSFVPEIEAKIMVQSNDLDDSVCILENVLMGVDK